MSYNPFRWETKPWMHRVRSWMDCSSNTAPIDFYLVVLWNKQSLLALDVFPNVSRLGRDWHISDADRIAPQLTGRGGEEAAAVTRGWSWGACAAGSGRPASPLSSPPSFSATTRPGPRPSGRKRAGGPPLNLSEGVKTSRATQTLKITPEAERDKAKFIIEQ